MAKELYPMELKAVRVRAEKETEAAQQTTRRTTHARKEKQDPKTMHLRLMNFADEGALDLLEFTHRERITQKALKKMAAEDEELQNALDYARDTIAMNLRATWRGQPQFKDYAHANVEYNDSEYKLYRNELRAQIAAKATGASTMLHITSDSLGMVASKENS